MSKDADMYARRIEREQIADRYVMDTLNQGEAEVFERYCLEHPEAVTEYEISRALCDGMLAAESTKGSWFERYPLGLAATVLLTVSIALNSWFYFENDQLQSARLAYVSETITFDKILTIDATRGAPHSVQIPIKDPVLLRIAVGPMGFEKYALVVRDPNNVTVLNRTGLTLDDDYNIFLNYAGLLKVSATYTLTIEGVGEQRVAIAEYRLITI